MPYPMGVFEALEAWQQGEITYRRALRLVGVDTIADLYAAAHSSGVSIRVEASAPEVELADHAVNLINRHVEALVAADAEVPRFRA
jgi:hypothetical protein